tara:strand:+ start:7679 stop:8440 length:762 start_codon:yes stop_codon:yes gene_type:complete
MSLAKILEDITENKTIAETDLDAVSPRAYPYKLGQVNSAKTKLEDLYITYKNELLSRAVFILVTGSESALFAEIAERDFKCFKTDAKTLFKEIADEIDPSFYMDKKVNASTFDVIGNILEDKLKRLDIVSYNTLMFNTKYERVIKNKNEFVQLIAEAVSDIVGPEVVGLDALERVSKDAVNKGYKSKMVPILLYSKDEDFIGGISNNLRTLSPKVVRVAAGETTNKNLQPLVSTTETNETNVGEALKTIAAKA